MSANKAISESRRAITRRLAFPAIFALLGLPWGGAAAQTARPPICAAMCDIGVGPIYRVGGDVGQPVVLQRVEPEYPEEARAASISGSVMVSIEIRPNGAAH